MEVRLKSRSRITDKPLSTEIQMKLTKPKELQMQS